MRAFVVPLLVASTLAVDTSKFLNVADDAPAHNADIARYINSLKTTWTATEEAPVWFANLNMGDAKKRMGAVRGKSSTVLPRKFAAREFNGTAPDSFDARTHWDSCPTIKVMRDQSACGSCWAFGAVEAMSDRICIHLGSKDAQYSNVSLSALDMISCCPSCGNGCEGGMPAAAWQYWVQQGLVTEDCEPYPFPKCEHHIPEKHYPTCQKDIFPTPDCPTACTNGTGSRSAAHYLGSSAYSVNGENDLIADLITSGPIEVTFTVYADFETYSSGIYQHTTGDELGGHAVKLIGYGVENGTKYWTISNSWNADWGEGGTFRIIRGTDECGIESDGTAGVPAALA